MWKHGEYNGFSWCIKVFDEGSRFGINNGKISKLWIQKKQNKEEVANYDRGWDIEATCKEAEMALCILLNNYN